jgi:nicotinate phosphoribosyltransferase
MSELYRPQISSVAPTLDVQGIREGLYTDRYFVNVRDILTAARLNAATADVGNRIVEAQVFTRHAPYSILAGMDHVLAVVRHCIGFFEGDRFVETWSDLDVTAVEDGSIIPYGGNPADVTPVMKIRGRYRDFALLETIYLGILSRATRIATSVYHVVKAANGKPVLFFPARFDLPSVQAADGHAYWVGLNRANRDTGHQVQPVVSTHAQGAWWGGKGGGTIPHALIATYMGDTVEATVAFAQVISPSVLRIALVDFQNNTPRESVATLTAYWARYREALASGDTEGQKRWKLAGVRLDTSGNLRDAGLGPDDPKGVNPVLVRTVRAALDNAWESWDVMPSEVEAAQQFCRSVQIIVSGGFDREKIERFEAEGVPVDVYGVGSTFLRNDLDTNTDFTMDIVRAKQGDEWVQVAKVGRAPNDNSELRPVDLSQF